MTRQKYGDDFHLGQVFTTPAITVTETHVVNWAGLTGDFYPLHMDAEYAAQTQFGERLAHGPMIFGLAVGMVALSGIGADSVIAWLGCDDMRMTGPVRIGDTIRTTVEVKEQRPTKDPKRGIQTWRYTVTNQRNEPILSFDYKMMFHMRGA
ncbi:MAG: MaoC family dehydratase N-terminal domain-containing protein [Rhodospirillales bacterium]|nr:MaoC family dehydratase N-terminal domain-containing protein [Rhodospirillales bacterium]